MKETSNYYLRKPERGTRPDRVDIEDLNYNADIIDGELDRLETAKTDRTEFQEHRTAAIIDHPNGSVTDAKIGNRTIGSNTANLTELLNDLANEIKVAKGTGDWEQEPQTDLAEAKAHIENRGNPHGVTKAQVGLANVDDTSDKNKPLSDAAIKALAEKVNVSDIVQETGTGEDKIMSQKAVTDALDNILGGDLDLSGYVKIAELVQETGDSTTDVMSQKAVTDELVNIQGNVNTAQNAADSAQTAADNAQTTANAAKAMGTASTRNATNDANNLPEDGWYVCNANFPSNLGNFAYVLQVSYTENMKMQLAFPYTPGSGANIHAIASASIYFRFKSGNYTDASYRGWRYWMPIIVGNPDTRGSNNNANSLPYDGWYLCNTNIPTPQFGQANTFCYVLQQTYGNNKLQIAMPYVSPGYRTLSFRTYYNNSWSDWVNTLTTTNIAKWILDNYITKISFNANNYITGFTGSTDLGIYSNHVVIYKPSSGLGYISASSFDTSSSRKLKQNIQPITLEQAKNILNVEPVEYELKDDDEHKKYYGMIAEDVYEIDPVPVTKINEEISGLKYTDFIAPLIKLIQDQEKRIKDLEDKINVDKT